MEATEILMTEHRAIERGLTVLERCASMMEAGNDVPAQALSDILDFIKKFADRCHHGKEEGFLFPALQRSGLPKQAGPLAVMMQDHDDGRRLVVAMSGALAGVSAGESSAIDGFCRNAHAFASLLRDHISKEDNVLFAMADMRLSHDEKSRLSAEFHAAETTGEACRLKSELLATLGRLEGELMHASGTGRS